VAVVLNFGTNERTKIVNALKRFSERTTSAEFEHKRWQILGCTVTLYRSGKLVIQGKNELEVKNLVLKLLQERPALVIGIDEAGRGEDYGPMVVVALLGERSSLREARDSKKVKDLSKKAELVEKNCYGVIKYTLNPAFIDSVRKQGASLNDVMHECIVNAAAYFKRFFDADCIVDGKPPTKTASELDVKFMVKADDKEPVVGAASILAKHERERWHNKDSRKTWKNAHDRSDREKRLQS
jgi:ribonuclease HII